MPSNALYFPYIDVPSTSWTTQAILYWDKLASIIPMDHLHHPEQMDNMTRELLSEGLVEPIIPGMHIYQAHRFDECFIDFVERTVLPSRRCATRREVVLPVSRIHAEKMGRIPDFLVESGLAKQLDWAWYEVDTPLANQFMAYLASVLGALPGVNATPITDRALFATVLGCRRPQPMRNTTLHAFKARQVVLKSILPVPNGPVNVGKLLSFKERHGHLLPQLRTRIEARCSLIALLPEPEDRVVATQDFINECNDQIAEIVAAMRPSFAKIALVSLTPLFGSGLALHATDPSNVVAYAGAATSLAGAAYQAISSIHAPRIAQEARPLAYLAHARRELAPSQTF
ncbi:DUF6236 family protein [Rhodoferax sp. UBA5149]|uniref:DUF6236 family protein n=1 Tax=Rhodoferax sp. UBA5149 TaxID=1947379 RepID=UPI0025E22AA8|nr:DUF6236 family protein [Rhodoferax sp. UBA5149]